MKFEMEGQPMHMGGRSDITIIVRYNAETWPIASHMADKIASQYEISGFKLTAGWSNERE